MAGCAAAAPASVVLVAAYRLIILSIVPTSIARRGPYDVLSDPHRTGAERASSSSSAPPRRIPAACTRRPPAARRLAQGPAARRRKPRRLRPGIFARPAGAPTTAAMAVTAGRRAARDAGQQPPDGPFTHQALEGFRRAAAADTPTRRGQAGGLTADECAAILATCMQRRRTGRGLERTETAERRGLVDSAIVGLLFHGALRRSEVAALRWAGVDLPTLAAATSSSSPVRRSKTDPTGGRADVRCLVGGCAAAVRSLPARDHPRNRGDSVVSLRADQLNLRFAAGCAPAGLEGRRTSHGGRVGLAVELTAPRGLHACHPDLWQLEGPCHGRPLCRECQHARREPSGGTHLLCRALPEINLDEFSVLGR